MGALNGVKVVEMAGIGPGPFAAMMLADMGADVVRVERPALKAVVPAAGPSPTLRGRTTVTLDVKSEEGRDAVRRLAAHADILLEGYRPGVMERMGLGPDVLLAANPRLVYGRSTGYGQDGPLSQVAGHDINYISIAGVLGAMRRPGERPPVPLNLVGDYGGGALMLTVGVLAALISGTGQVVDAAMTEGASLLATAFHGLRAGGDWHEEAGTNVLDGGAHFYDTYETADGRFVAVGAIEPQFYAELLRVLGLEPADHPQWERGSWPRLGQRFAAVFRTRTLAQWTEAFASRDACVTPVLELHEAAEHPQNVARRAFGDGIPVPVPRLSATPSQARDTTSSNADEVLGRWA